MKNKWIYYDSSPGEVYKEDSLPDHSFSDCYYAYNPAKLAEFLNEQQAEIDRLKAALAIMERALL